MQAIRKYPVCTNYLKYAFRGVCSETLQMINIEPTTDERYNVLEMNRKPVNSMSLEFLQEMNEAMRMLENDPTCRGVIISSKLHAVYGSGLELTELYNPDPERLEKLWKEFQALKINLFSSPLVLISAINGACLAGACVIPFSCDYRIMAGDSKHKIGLPATKIGVTPPFWLIESMKLLIGHRETEKMLFKSLLFKPQDALAKGIVDEIVPPDELLPTSKREMEKWLTIPDTGRVETKKLIRRNFIEEFHRKRDEDLKFVMKCMLDLELQQSLGAYIKKLKEKEL